MGRCQWIHWIHRGLKPGRCGQLLNLICHVSYGWMKGRSDSYTWKFHLRNRKLNQNDLPYHVGYHIPFVIWRVPWGAWFQSFKLRSPQGNLDMNLFKIKLRRYRRKQNQLWNQVAQHSFVSKWAWIKSYLPSQTSLGYFGILFCSCPNPGIWLTEGVMTYSAKRSMWTQIYLPSKQRTANQRSAQALQSIRFVFWPVLHILKQFCVMHDACKDVFASFSRSVQFTVIAVAAFLYHLNWICTIYTIICYAHVGPSWPYFGPSRQLKARNVFIWHLVPQMNVFIWHLVPQMNTLILGPLEVCWASFLLSVVEINSRQGLCWANVRPTRG